MYNTQIIMHYCNYAETWQILSWNAMMTIKTMMKKLCQLVKSMDQKHLLVVNFTKFIYYCIILVCQYLEYQEFLLATPV